MVSDHPSVAAFAACSIENCYQCGKCTAGCPVAASMDVPPNKIFRLVQLGEVDKAMRCEAIWLCVSCFTCTARCPQSVDCVGVIDVLRQMAAEDRAASPKQLRICAFQRAFLDNIRRNGRVNEMELIAEFKVAGFLKDLSIPLLFKDAMLGPKMLKRGKLHPPLSGRVRDRGVVRRIFDRCAQHSFSTSKQSGEEPAQ